MEPRSFERGKTSVMFHVALASRMLQWSRVRLNAERAWRQARRAIASQLQWSRVRLNAERPLEGVA